MNASEMAQKIKTGDGFIAALDQSGGSTPKALAGYGIEEGAWSSDEEMFGLIHQMRSRIITSPCFGSGKVIGAIKPTGVRPKFMPKIEEAGISLPPTIFGLSNGYF